MIRAAVVNFEVVSHTCTASGAGAGAAFICGLHANETLSCFYPVWMESIVNWQSAPLCVCQYRGQKLAKAHRGGKMWDSFLTFLEAGIKCFCKNPCDEKDFTQTFFFATDKNKTRSKKTKQWGTILSIFTSIYLVCFECCPGRICGVTEQRKNGIYLKNVVDGGVKEKPHPRELWFVELPTPGVCTRGNNITAG